MRLNKLYYFHPFIGGLDVGVKTEERSPDQRKIGCG